MGFGHATQAEPFSFDYLHLIVPGECSSTSISKSENPMQNRYGQNVISDADILYDMAEGGSAYIYPHDYKDISLIERLLEAEDQARTNRTGCIWSSNKTAFNTAENIQDTGQFIIVQGIILDVYESYENIYLNFGPEWKTDFTVRIDKSNKSFKNMDLKTYIDKTIQVRGFVEYYNGPSLTLEHPTLIRITSQ